jgi:hypothetical protein
LRNIWQILLFILFKILINRSHGSLDLKKEIQIQKIFIILYLTNTTDICFNFFLFFSFFFLFTANKAWAWSILA